MSEAPTSFRGYAAASRHPHMSAGEQNDAEVVTLTNVFFDENNQNWQSWKK
jgi:hypothetical protein